MNNLTRIITLTILLLLNSSCQMHKKDFEVWESKEISYKKGENKLTKSELYIYTNNKIRIINYYYDGKVEKLNEQYTIIDNQIVIDAGKMPPYYLAIARGTDFLTFESSTVKILYRMKK